MPGVCTKGPGIASEALEIPQDTQGRWSRPRIRKAKCGRHGAVCHHVRKRGGLGGFPQQLCVVVNFCSSCSMKRRRRRPGFIVRSPCSLSVEDPSLSGTGIKIMLMELAAPSATGTKGASQQSGKGRESEERSPGLGCFLGLYFLSVPRSPSVSKAPWPRACPAAASPFVS